MLEQAALAGATMELLGFGLWYYLLGAGWAENAARNLVLPLMVLFQNYHVFNCHSDDRSAFCVSLRSNRVLTMGVVAALGLYLLAMQLPFMQSLLGVAPVTPAQSGGLLLLAANVLMVMELYTLLTRGRSAQRPAPRTPV
ncbi:MAG: hypothetical protein OHK0015_01900 [Chloroflexi bacterium OHK40]